MLGVLSGLLSERFNPIRMHRMLYRPLSKHKCAMELHVLFNRSICRLNRTIELWELHYG